VNCPAKQPETRSQVSKIGYLTSDGTDPVVGAPRADQLSKLGNVGFSRSTVARRSRGLTDDRERISASSAVGQPTLGPSNWANQTLGIPFRQRFLNLAILCNRCVIARTSKNR
jgi:hypothetical protein